MKSIIIFILLLLSSYFFTFAKEDELNNEETSPTISVTVEGAVNYPGTYQLEEANMDSLFNQIELTANADCGCINMERSLLEGDIVFIPDRNQIKVSLNSGSSEDLQTIKGIGESKANKIITYRQEHSFMAIEDIMNISGIGYKTYLKWRDYLCL